MKARDARKRTTSDKKDHARFHTFANPFALLFSSGCPCHLPSDTLLSEIEGSLIVGFPARTGSVDFTNLMSYCTTSSIIAGLHQNSPSMATLCPESNGWLRCFARRTCRKNAPTIAVVWRAWKIASRKSCTTPVRMQTLPARGRSLWIG